MIVEKRPLRFLGIILTFVLLTLSCKNDPDPIQTQLQLLQRKNGWQIISSIVDPPLETPTGLIRDTYPLILPCHKDDILVFEENGDLSVIDEIRCTPPENDYPPGVYFFNEEKKLLSFNGELGSEVLVSNRELKFKLKEVVNGVSIVLSLTYVGK